MNKLLSVFYMFLCFCLALIFDTIFDALRRQFAQNFKFAPLIIGGIFLNLFFTAALLLLTWLVLSRTDKSLIVSIVFLLTGIVPVFFMPVILAISGLLFRGMPDFMVVPVMGFLKLVSESRSYFSITGTFVLGIGLINLFRLGKSPAPE